MAKSTSLYFYCADCDVDYTFTGNNELYCIWLNLNENGIVALILDLSRNRTSLFFDSENKEMIHVPYLIEHVNPANLRDKIHLILNFQ